MSSANLSKMDVGVSIPTHVRVINVTGLPVESKSDPRAQPVPQSRRRTCAVVIMGIFFLVGAVLGALYVNVLNSLPEFVDEDGSSTIELLIGVQDTSIAMDMSASALPSSMWHTYDLHKADCTMEVSSKNMKGPMQLVDFTIEFEDFHVEPNSPATVELTANITPSKAWPAEQARYGLDPRAGVADAIRTVAGDAPLSGAVRCNLDVSAKLFNSIDTGVMSLQHTFKLDGVEAFFNKDADFYVSQEVFDAVNFQNITDSLLSGKAIEAALGAPIELFLNEHPLSTTALKEFGVRVDPVEMSVGVSKTPLPGAGSAPPARLSHWNIDVGALHLDLQNSKCIESGTTVAFTAGTFSNGTGSTSVLTPAARAFSELASAGSASFPLVFQNHQLWFEFLFGKNHVATALLKSTHDNSKAVNSTLNEGGAGGRARRNLLQYSQPLDSYYNDDFISGFTDCNLKEAGAPEETCFEVKLDDSTAIQMCGTQGGCQIGISAHVKVETFPIHLTGEALLNFADTENIEFEASGRDGKGPHTAAISGVVTSDDSADSFNFNLVGDASVDDSDYPYDIGFVSEDSSLHMQGNIKGEDGVVFSVDAKPSLDFDSSSLTMPPATLHDGNTEWQTDFDVQCAGFENGMGKSVGTEETRVCTGEWNLFKKIEIDGSPRSVREMKVDLDRAAVDFDGDSGGLELRMAGTRQGDPMSWVSAVGWDLDSNTDNIDANVVVDLSSAEGETFVFKTSKVQVRSDTTGLLMDATIEQTNSAKIVMGVDMQCDNVAGSMYPEQVYSEGAIQPSSNDHSEDTRFCTGTLNLDYGSDAYAFTVEKAALDDVGDACGVELKSHGTIKGDYVKLDFLVGFNLLNEIVTLNLYGPSTKSTKSVDLFHTMKVVSRSGETFAIELEPSVSFDTVGIECTGTITNGGTKYGMDMNMECDNHEGSMYAEKVVAAGATRPYPDPNDSSSEETAFCTGSLDLTMDGADEYTFKIQKAAADVFGPGGGLKLESTGTIAGDPIKLDILVGWNELSEIIRSDGAPDNWYTQYSYGTGLRSTSRNWEHGPTQSVDLFHTITYSSPSKVKFEFSTQPKIDLRNDRFKADVPVTMELEGEQHEIDASVDCGEANSPTIGDGAEYGCKSVKLSVESDGKVRASADLRKVAINLGGKGGIALDGEVFAESSDQLIEYSVGTDLQWKYNDNLDTLTVDPMHASVTQVTGFSQRSRRAGAQNPNVFAMDGAIFMDFDPEGIADFFNKMEMSMSMDMETSATKRLSLSFGDKSFEPTTETIAVVDVVSASEFSAGSTTLRLPNVGNIKVGDILVIGKGASQEKVKVTAVTSDGVTLERGLKNKHDAGTKLSFQSMVDDIVVDASSASSAYCSAIVALAAIVTATMV